MPADDLTGLILALSPKPRLDFFPLWHRCTLRLVGLLSPFSYTVGEWTLNALLTTSSSYRKCSKRRTLDHSAQATSRLRVEGTTKCSRIARGFSFGIVTASAAVPDAYTYAPILSPSLDGRSFGVPYQTHRQERTEKHIKCQAKPRPPVRHTGVVDEEAMDEVKNAVPNKGSDY
jgi:hypothetical protein